jgi:hypothetical protein
MDIPSFDFGTVHAKIYGFQYYNTVGNSKNLNGRRPFKGLQSIEFIYNKSMQG